MKIVSWILVGVSLIVYVALNESRPQYATGSDDVEDVAGKASQWSSKQRVSGIGHNVFGSVKERLGQAIGNDDLVVEGAAEQVVGSIKDAVSQTAHAVGRTIDAFNR